MHCSLVHWRMQELVGEEENQSLMGFQMEILRVEELAYRIA